jgi:hypothetical protein
MNSPAKMNTAMTNPKEPTAQLTLKLPKALRDAFTEACDRNDTNASREIRAFMRDYLKRHGQKDLEL